MQVTVLCLLHVRLRGLVRAEGLGTVALEQRSHHVVKAWPGLSWVGPRVGQLWPGRGSQAASIPASWCSGPGQGSSLPTVAPGHVARWGPLTTARRGEENARAAAATVFRGRGCAGSGGSPGSTPLTVSQTHFCGNQLGPACLPEAASGDLTEAASCPHTHVRMCFGPVSACQGASGSSSPSPPSSSPTDTTRRK